MTFPKVDEYRQIMADSIQPDLTRIADLKSFLAIVGQMGDPAMERWFVRQVALNCSDLLWRQPQSPFPIEQIEFHHIEYLIDVA